MSVEGISLDWWQTSKLNRYEIALQREKLRERGSSGVLHGIDRDVIDHASEPIFRSGEMVEAPIEDVIRAPGMPPTLYDNPSITKNWAITENDPKTGKVILMKLLSIGEQTGMHATLTTETTEVALAHAMENPRS